MSQLTWLFSRFRENSAKNFIIWRDRSFSYDWLLGQVQDWKVRLEAERVAPGSVVAIEGDYSPEVVALLLALIERNAVIVPLTDSVEAHKAEFKDIAEVQVIIAFSSRQASKVSRRQIQVTNKLTQRLIATGSAGLVLFSSGSTGKSKAAIHDFIPLLEKFKRLRPTWTTLTFLLLDHIGGINTLLYVLSNTGTIVAIENRDPDIVCRAIERHRVELMPTSPTFLNLLLLSEAYQRFDLSSLKRITYGTEAMPKHTLQRLHTIFPTVVLQQTYGLSELGILQSKSRSADSLWVKVGGEGFETKIVDGILWIRARSAMLGYLNAPSPFDDDGWFNTGDAVEVDGEYIKILGRKSDIINVGGSKAYATKVEDVLMQMDNVRDAAVTAEENPIVGQIVVARLALEDPEELTGLRKRMRTFCRDKLARHEIPAKITLERADLHGGRFKKMRYKF